MDYHPHNHSFSPQATQKAVKLATKMVWGAAKSVMTMSVDKSLLEAGFNAAELGVEKVRQMGAKKYADKFSAFASFEASIEADSGSVEEQVEELWAHLVLGDRRWETRASFSVMVTNVILKVGGQFSAYLG